jgi:type VI secretion system ImpA family protein
MKDTMIDVMEFAKPLTGEKPAGENMEYDQGYLELEVIAAGQGAGENAAPDWKLLAKSCTALWEKTRDLRVAVYLTIAETATGGVQELSAGLRLIHFLVREMWDTMYPLLDPDDDNDPTERINIFAMLSPEAGAMNDPIMFINRLRETKIIPVLPYTIRDLLIAQGEIEPLDGKTVDLNLIIGELMGIPPSRVSEQADYAKAAKESLESIGKEANEKISGGDTVALTSLGKELDRLIKFFNNYFAIVAEKAEEETPSKEVPAETVSVKGEFAADEKQEPPKPSSSGVPVNMTGDKPATREEALLLLGRVIEYYQNMEPNSPIPLLLNRALRMARMNFLELLENLVPEAAAHGKDILGVLETSGSQSQTARPRSAPASVPQSPRPDSALSADSAPPHIPRIPRT